MPRAKKMKEGDLTAVEGWEIERFARLHTTQKKLNELYGEGNWTVETARDRIHVLVLESRLKKVEPDQITARQATLATNERGRKVAARAQAYMDKYTNVTPNDRVLFGELADIEERLSELSAEQYTELEPAARYKALESAGSFRLKLVDAHRKLQTDLGIGRTQRKDELEKEKEMRRLVEGGRSLLGQYGTMIACHRCRAPTRINQGFILFHFREAVPWRWESICPNPKCRAKIVIAGGPDVPVEIEPPPPYETPLLEKPQ